MMDGKVSGEEKNQRTEYAVEAKTRGMGELLAKKDKGVN